MRESERKGGRERRRGRGGEREVLTPTLETLNGIRSHINLKGERRKEGKKYEVKPCGDRMVIPHLFALDRSDAHTSEYAPKQCEGKMVTR
jgi:hypothetical protein